VGIDVVNFGGEPFEGAAKLHNLGKRELEHLLVEEVEGVLNDCAGTLLLILGDGTNGGIDTEVAKVTDKPVWKDYPGALLDHVSHFFVKEFRMFIGAFVRSTSQCIYDSIGAFGGQANTLLIFRS
jgi:hypothetical protein